MTNHHVAASPEKTNGQVGYVGIIHKQSRSLAVAGISPSFVAVAESSCPASHLSPNNVVRG